MCEVEKREKDNKKGNINGLKRARGLNYKVVHESKREIKAKT